MLKTLNTTLAKPKKGIVGVGSDSRKEYGDRTKPISRYGIGDDEFDDEFDNKVGKKEKTSKSKKLFKSKKIIRSLDFLTPGAKLAFAKLR